MYSADHPLQPVVAQWLRVIRAGHDAKQKRFGKDADEALKFLTGPYDFFWDQLAADRHMRASPGHFNVSESGIKIQVNKVAEFVQLFGPALYARNPKRTVNPRQFPELPAELYAMMGPQAQMIFQQDEIQDLQERSIDKATSQILETYQNQTPAMTDLRTNSRQSVDEALIKGMGVLWQEPYVVPGGGYQLAGSFHDTVDNLIIDPDATSLRDAKWIARRCCHPTWQVEEEFGLPPGSLKERGTFSTNSQVAAQDAALDYFGKRTGKTSDMIVYWRIWSKMGCGGRLSEVMPEMRPMLEVFGKFCYLCVADGVPFPLNVPPDVINNPNGAPIARDRMQWPTPFWLSGGWPMIPIYFHEAPGEPWPLSHLGPAMGELKFLNWAYGHIASKIRSTTRDFIAVLTGAGETIKTKILSGGDLELLELTETHGKTIDQVVQFLQHPSFNGDIWRVMEAVMHEFEKRTGLTELMYGETGKQIRSGSEAQLKGDAMNIRPDDMAESVEDAMSKAAANEALVAKWHLQPSDVQPVLGTIGSKWWQQLIYAADPRRIIFNLVYRIESGSAKKPNKQRDQEQATALMNNLFTPFYQYASATGDMQPVNKLLRFWAKANDFPNPDEFVLQPVPPPQPAAAPGANGQPKSTKTVERDQNGRVSKVIES